LNRPVPEFAHRDGREPARRVAARESARPEPVHELPGQKLPVEPKVRDLRLKEAARPEPNAPLLMRLVRTPFSLAPAAMDKVATRESQDEIVRGVVEREGPGRAFADLLREIGRHGWILREGAARRPAPRPRPFRRERS
jgi:hypothetical protein